MSLLKIAHFLLVLINLGIHVKQPKYFFSNFNIQYGPQLNLWNGVEKEMIRRNNYNQYLHKTHILPNSCISYRMSTSSNAAATTRKLFEKCDENMEMSNGQKRQVNGSVVSSQKKAKGKGIVSKCPPFWLGYHTLNAIAYENEEPIEPTLSISELVKRGMSQDEALEHLVAVPSFPYIPQEAWLSKWMDGKEGGHFNLTQVPFDVEVDEDGFALNYQIAIAFELGERNLTRDDIYTKTMIRLQKMNIELGH